MRPYAMIVLVALGAALAGCVKAPSELRQQAPHAEGETALGVAEAALCIARATSERWAGFGAGYASVEPSGERAEVQIQTNYLVGVVDIEKRAAGAHMTVWLHHGWNFPVTDGEAAAHAMIETCGGHATPA